MLAAAKKTDESNFSIFSICKATPVQMLQYLPFITAGCYTLLDVLSSSELIIND